MWRCALLASLVSLGGWAFAPAPIQWGPEGRFVVAPTDSALKNLRLASPQNLAVFDRPVMASNDMIPRFTPNPDQTISWKLKGWCLEAGGDKVGDVVRVSECSGGKSQKWNLVPNGHGQEMIQLKDTNKCLDVADKGHGLNGAPIELSECDAEVPAEGWTQLSPHGWEFEEPLHLTTQGISVRCVAISLISILGLGTMSLGAWIWRWQRKTSTMGTSQAVNMHQRFKPTVGAAMQELVLAVMSVSASPVAATANDDEQDEQRKPPFPCVVVYNQSEQASRSAVADLRATWGQRMHIVETIEEGNEVPSDVDGVVYIGEDRWGDLPHFQERLMSFVASDTKVDSFKQAGQLCFMAPWTSFKGCEESAQAVHAMGLDWPGNRPFTGADEPWEDDGAERVPVTDVEGLKWLEEKSHEDGVIETSSGLMYRVLESSGSDKYPGKTTKCQCHYEGRLIDGTKFDSSYDRGRPGRFAPSQVIPGWTEAMQLMREGDKWELFIPADLAYGASGTPDGTIPPKAALHFTMTLVKVGS